MHQQEKSQALASPHPVCLRKMRRMALSPMASVSIHLLRQRKKTEGKVKWDNLWGDEGK